MKVSKPINRHDTTEAITNFNIYNCNRNVKDHDFSKKESLKDFNYSLLGILIFSSITYYIVHNN